MNAGIRRGARRGGGFAGLLLALLAFAGAAAPPAPAGAPAASGTADAIPPDGRPANGDPPRTAMPFPGCPKALLGEMLAEAAEGDGAVAALAIEREALVLCAQREEAVKRVLALEGEVRALLPRPAAPVPAAGPGRPAPARPSYGWFSIIGSGDRLRAGVTDGRRAWFVRPGDLPPGGARIGAVRPSGAVLSGGAVLPYRAPPGGAP